MDSKNLVFIDDKDDVINHLKNKESEYSASFIIDNFDVGSHIEKGKCLSDTLNKLSPRIPHQIFLTSHSSYFNISDDEISKCSDIIERKGLRIFVHTPYLLNLANEDKYIVSSLKNHLIVSSKMKFKGCVVHVGKSTKKTIEEATKNMINNIVKSIQFATPECPLLLETPAGQGTEMLTNREDFMNFIKSIDDARLGICIDTCHVFSSGYMPMDYINYVIDDEKLLNRLKLFHYNDSEKECKSCVDRHALLFYGKIPMEEMIFVAFTGQNYGIPLVIE